MGLFKSKPKEQPAQQQAPPAVPMNGSKIDRVNQNDKAILNLKATMRQMRTYQDKLQIQEKEVLGKIKDLMNNGEKSRALIQLKRKKYIGKELDKIDGAYAMMQDQLGNIESAQADVDIFKALEQGQAVVKDLQKQVSNADWDDMYAEHQEQLEQQEMDQKIFGEALDDGALDSELDALVAQEVAKQMGDLEPQNVIAKQQVVEDEEPAEKVKPKRQLVAA